MQLAVAPPLDPPQLHVHGPEPATDDAVPAEQRPAEGLDDTLVPFADPHTPLTGAVATPTTPSPFRSWRKLGSSDLSTELEPETTTPPVPLETTVAVAVGVPDRVLVRACHTERDLIAARRLLRPDVAPARYCPTATGEPLIFEQRAAAAADGVEVKVVPHLHQAG